MQTGAAHRQPISGFWHTVYLGAAVFVILALTGAFITWRKGIDDQRKYVIEQKKLYLDYIAWNKWRVPTQEVFKRYSPAVLDIVNFDPMRPDAPKALKNALARFNAETKAMRAQPAPLIAPGTVAKQRELSLSQFVKDYSSRLDFVTNFHTARGGRVSAELEIAEARMARWVSDYVKNPPKPRWTVFGQTRRPRLPPEELGVAKEREFLAGAKKMDDKSIRKYLASTLARFHAGEIRRMHDLLKSAVESPAAVPSELDVEFARSLK